MQDIHVFNFDDSVTSQTTLLKQFDQYIHVSDFRLFRQAARLWTSPSDFAQIKNQMIMKKPGFSFLGSGDYHHFSLALIEQIKTPLTVVLFDNHPDWMKPPHQYHCGTWVYSLARLEQVKKIIIIGLESGDIEGDQFDKGDVESFNSGKITLFPHRPVAISVEGSVKYLSSQLTVDLQQGIEEILQTIATEDVYISLDKDCLRKEDAFTNWEQGTLPLATVLSCIQAIRQRFNIIGADTVGDYSPPRFVSPLKWIGSLLDRPSNAFKLSSQPRLTARNEFANSALLNMLIADA